MTRRFNLVREVKTRWLSWFLIGILLVILYGALERLDEVKVWWGEATGKPAHIIVASNHYVEPLEPFWQGISQGLEGNETMLEPVENEGKDISLQLVRVDHIFDHYGLVTRGPNGRLLFDFSRLDRLVLSILRMNARPVFSLSYMPEVISDDGTSLGKPRNWEEWELVVKNLVERYSGKKGWGIPEIYYEVWNEPDLFGGWHYSTKQDGKNYLELYQHTYFGVARAVDVERYYLGGPATTAMYPNWIRNLLKAATEGGWKLDFISWHTYSSVVGKYADDVAWVRQLLSERGLDEMQLIISEWGLNSDLDSGNDNALGAAHLVAVVEELADQNVDWVLPFELKDGLDPNGKSLWGRWGMLTHELHGLVKKPKYNAYVLLNRLASKRLLVLGEGSWVKALASEDQNGGVQILIVNYDSSGKHSEMVPIDVLGLDFGQYTWVINRLNGSKESGTDRVESVWSKSVFTPANEVLLLELKKTDILD